MKSVEMKSCKICGGKADITQNATLGVGYTVECKCGRKIDNGYGYGFRTPKVAISAWNQQN
jgi:hypothetical protein